MTMTEHPPAADPGAHAAGDDGPPDMLSAVQEAEAETAYEIWRDKSPRWRGTIVDYDAWMEAWRLARHAAFLQVEDAIRRAKVDEVAAEVAREGCRG